MAADVLPMKTRTCLRVQARSARIKARPKISFIIQRSDRADFWERIAILFRFGGSRNEIPKFFEISPNRQ